MSTAAASASARLGAAALAASLVLIATPALADVKAGVDAWTAGDYTRAVVEWQGPAAAGDPDALFNLAQAYRLGRGVDVDNARARKLYEEAASFGHVKAADNYGLMLFQEGEQEKAMPMIRAASERGDPRAQYVLGLSHFNADYAPRDWVRAYALMTLANGSGLPQARDALAQMDKFVPTAQRSQAQSLARQLEAGAKSLRASELAAVELGTAASSSPASPVMTPVSQSAPRPPVMTQTAAAAPAVLAAPRPQPAPVPAAPKQGKWRVQLGAFGVAGNADRLWNQLSGNPALAGTSKTLVPSGNVTRLLATGFANEAEANRACAALKKQGQACLVAGQR
ncbi:SPOR domain-containing protein [Porphyrobacter sp. AAP60]|uniref:SPOR domain-containing protein n=1 Tax=Porphyrobacter sp. AAP60 TaxID=1523423 RepID=UPI0006B89247|nr:SPOR domain-containing protein [Porphyrobacter sp. AAP60]KPF62917.1 sporulation protein [Porphyrobacter sp. AAP60]